MSKIKIYPKFCESENCNKGICEGWTNEHINLCDDCFDKEEDWKKDAYAMIVLIRKKIGKKTLKKSGASLKKTILIIQIYIELLGMLKNWTGFLMKKGSGLTWTD